MGAVRRIVLAGVLAAAGLVGMAPPEARGDACPADSLASYARVQLFKDSDCSGPSVSVGFTGSGDRPDFAAFANYEGSVYDIDDTRDSLAVAPATCVRLFDGKSYTGAATGLMCSPANADGLFADLGTFKNRASSMRVCPSSAQNGCAAATTPPPPPRPTPNGSPATADARLNARLGHRELGFGERTRLRIGLITADGRPIAGAAVQMLTRENRSGAEWKVAPALTTGPDGRAVVTLPAGPSRRIRIEYRTNVGDAEPAVTRAVKLAVRAGVTLRITPRHVRAGHSIRLRGRLLARPATRLGKIVTLQARERGRWRDFKSARTGGRGRFSTRYHFTSGARGTFPIRAVARADAAYPYATGRSHTVRVHVR
jgi:hypothetical protein